MKTTALSCLKILVCVPCLIWVSGCGGGGGNSVSGSSPTRATKNRVLLQQTHNVNALMRNGGSSLSAASTANGGTLNSSGVGSGSNSGAGGGTSTGGVNSGSASGSLPLVGAFIKNVASTPKAVRSARIRRAVRSRDASNLYFDDYLGLWVQETDTSTQSTYLLFQDSAGAVPAGSIVTTYPAADSTTQVYASTYTFLAGVLSGSHGSYTYSYYPDGSSYSSYQDAVADGSSDSGTSTSTADGEYAWTSKSTLAGGLTTSDRGAFHPDGSGSTHSRTSDGIISDYYYNADGSGRGTIRGSADGLPAVIVWDNIGNTTITWADGTVDQYNTWCLYALDSSSAGSTTNSSP